jgi:hypothetical protein
MKPKQGFSPGQTRKIATSQYPTLEKQFVLFFQRPFIRFLLESRVRVYHSIRNNTIYFIIFWSFLLVRVTPFWAMPIFAHRHGVDRMLSFFSSRPNWDSPTPLKLRRVCLTLRRVCTPPPPP